jgi:hypothetical protein
MLVLGRCECCGAQCRQGSRNNGLASMGKKLDDCCYPLLKVCNLLVGHGISLGDNRDQIDFCVQSAHKLNVNLLETMTRRM